MQISRYTTEESPGGNQSLPHRCNDDMKSSRKDFSEDRKRELRSWIERGGVNEDEVIDQLARRLLRLGEI